MNEKMIDRWVAMLKDGYGEEQIMEEIWSATLYEYHTVSRLDTIIILAMKMYGEVMRRSLK